MPEIGDSDSSDDEDPEVLHKKYGYGRQDTRDQMRTRRLDREEEQRIAVGEIAIAITVATPLHCQRHVEINCLSQNLSKQR